MKHESDARERIAILGYGRIGKTVAERLLRDDFAILTDVVTRRCKAASASLPDAVRLHERLDDALSQKQDVVIECASPALLAEHAPAILGSGADLVAVSLSAFTAPETEARILRAAEAGPGRLFIPSGAACALPLLRVAKQAGIDHVHFRQTYPPSVWQKIAGGAPETGFHGVFFRGSVREAAKLFPRNLNAAVGIALAGLGMDETTIELVAHPGIANMRYELEIESLGAPMRLDIGPYDDLAEEATDHTAFSVLSMLKQRSAAVCF
ncbi:aspartate dehydrogenase domain-containing protein [Martelella mediterranea]|uniref:Aspartate dehydrogenase n=1 Tax=Martelella mediterranea TaxID=293089 RepID=A0A4R3NSS2_9HYPH|nr:aspartate dehydrogenase domain-containing protein [Martelella mediterranea]TCT36277.1 aspartate dehydrogenase [Martelella mediterranea]